MIDFLEKGGTRSRNYYWTSLIDFSAENYYDREDVESCSQVFSFCKTMPLLKNHLLPCICNF